MYLLYTAEYIYILYISVSDLILHRLNTEYDIEMLEL